MTKWRTGKNSLNRTMTKIKRFLDVRYLVKRRDRIVPVLGRCLRTLGVRLDPSSRILHDLKDRHLGQQCCIVGNGPSLNIADLELLGKMPTFASNKIFLAFQSTKWRPTFYSVFDELVARNNAEVVSGLTEAGLKLFGDRSKSSYGARKNIVWVHEMPDNGDVFGDGPQEAWKSPLPRFSTDASIGVHAGGTVVYAQLQMAFHMGFRRVILLGVDYSFSVPQSKVQTNVFGYETALVAAGEKNHFHPDYRKPGEVWAVPRLDHQHMAFRAAKDAYERVGGTVLNASRRTQLDVFKRQSLEEMLAQNIG